MPMRGFIHVTTAAGHVIIGVAQIATVAGNTNRHGSGLTTHIRLGNGERIDTVESLEEVEAAIAVAVDPPIKKIAKK